jgi:hypothetical protein
MRNKQFQDRALNPKGWVNMFNLHDLSEGEALLACYYIFSCTQDASIILGKGLHRRGNSSKIRNIVFNFAHRYGITVRTLGNEGRIQCSRAVGILGWQTSQGMLTLQEAVRESQEQRK